jgi:hypothetical protein
MDTRIDHKGKYFTERISKHHVAVVARTAGEFVHGVACLTPDNRLKDELNGTEGFLAILDAEVRDGLDKLVLYSAPVVLLNKQQLVWVLPLGHEGLEEDTFGAADGEGDA